MNVRGDLGENNSKHQLAKPSQTSNEIQVWTLILEEKSNDRLTKMREEMDSKLETILKNIGLTKVCQQPQIPGQKQKKLKIHNHWDPDI